MRLLLGEALRQLCGEIGWSYAVFWRSIRCGSSRNLVWLEGHHEAARVSPVADGIGELVEKTMRSQIHVEGNGVIGLAAITGRHRWIIRGEESYESEVSGEMNLQFSAGIMTTAVIPVLPHGVVQLGSIQTIRENLAFVEHVRRYFLQLPPLDRSSFPVSENPFLRDPINPPTDLRHTIGSNLLSGIQSTSSYSITEENSCELLESSGQRALPCSSGDDLFDVLGIHFKQKRHGGVDSPPFDAHLDIGSIFDSLQDGISSCGAIFSDPGPDQLLDAVVSKIMKEPKQQISEDELVCRSTITTANTVNLHLHPLVLKSEAPANGECSYKSNISLWVDRIPGGRMEDGGKSTRKRQRPGDGPRPRPKDRQMIQDRVKELREIVPNGAKCSIDALLERTIKHMLFLQSVTKHADLLKQAGEPKMGEERVESGATWAFDVGARPPVCPIIVEDLHPPRRLMVEMLCEERGFFLEIADLIKGLGLTILKGVMEARKDKVWARFAVEANRDVTRMDIFMSLVRLLEPAQALEKANIACNAICQPSIPATGMGDRRS